MLACIWIAEFIHLPHLLYGVPAVVEPGRASVRTAVVLAIWAWVHFSTRRLLRRLHELEEFLIMCSWCRKISHDGKWLTTEEFFGSQLATSTSHGVCPECASQQMIALRANRVPTRPPM